MCAIIDLGLYVYRLQHARDSTTADFYMTTYYLMAFCLNRHFFRASTCVVATGVTSTTLPRRCSVNGILVAFAQQTLAELESCDSPLDAEHVTSQQTCDWFSSTSTCWWCASTVRQVAQSSDALLPAIHWIVSGVSGSVTAEQCSVAVLWPARTSESDGGLVITVFSTEHSQKPEVMQLAKR